MPLSITPIDRYPSETLMIDLALYQPDIAQNSFIVIETVLAGLDVLQDAVAGDSLVADDANAQYQCIALFASKCDARTIVNVFTELWFVIRTGSRSSQPPGLQAQTVTSSATTNASGWRTAVSTVAIARTSTPPRA